MTDRQLLAIILAAIFLGMALGLLTAEWGVFRVDL